MDQLTAKAAAVERANNPDEGDWVHEYISGTARKLDGTPRFLFDDKAIHLAAELSLGRPKVLLDALAHLLIPYSRMWVEWAETGRAQLRQAFAEPVSITVPDDDEPPPTRVGFFLDVDHNGRKGTCTWCWGSADDSPMIEPVEVRFDLDARFNLDAELKPYLLHRARDGHPGFLRGVLMREWGDNPVQLAAVDALWATSDHRLLPMAFPMATRLKRAADDQRERAISEAVAYGDAYGEYIMIWAIMIVLTAHRKAVEHTPVSRERLNKARSKRGDPLLLDHTSVTLFVGDRERAAQPVIRGPLDYTRKSPRLHLVSSFLTHRGDKYWVVRPYWRGQGTPISRYIYVKG